MKLIFLSDTFYSKYQTCSEILQKKDRPYACLAVRIEHILFAIPFRHHIPHQHAFFTVKDCGLDYTKAVVISELAFISSEQAHIDQVEFNALKGKDHIIENGMRRYLRLYKKAYQYRTNPRYRNILRYSSLKHFHEYLNLPF